MLLGRSDATTRVAFGCVAIAPLVSPFQTAVVAGVAVAVAAAVAVVFVAPVDVAAAQHMLSYSGKVFRWDVYHVYYHDLKAACHLEEVHQ